MGSILLCCGLSKIKQGDNVLGSKHIQRYSDSEQSDYCKEMIVEEHRLKSKCRSNTETYLNEYTIRRPSIH